MLYFLRLLVVNSLDLASLHELRSLVEQHCNLVLFKLLHGFTVLFWLSLQLLHDDSLYLLEVCHQWVLWAEMLLEQLFACLQLGDGSLGVVQLLEHLTFDEETLDSDVKLCHELDLGIPRGHGSRPMWSLL